jgi:hypothetical protein
MRVFNCITFLASVAMAKRTALINSMMRDKELLDNLRESSHYQQWTEEECKAVKEPELDETLNQQDTVSEFKF